MPTTRVNDLDIYFEIEGSGPPVICIAGMTGDHLAWAMQVPAIVAAGYRCLTFDSRDTGQTVSAPGAYSIRDLAADTLGLLDALDIPSAHIIGSSMGGMIGQEMAIAAPGRVASLTLVCSTARIDSVMAGVVRAWRAQRPHGAPDEFLLSLSPWLFTHRFYQQEEAVRGFLQMAAANPFPQSVEKFQRQCDAVLMHDTRDRLSQIATPTHVIVGAEDILTPLRLSRELADGISGATLTVMPDVGHGLFWERAEAFNQKMLAFPVPSRL